MAKITDFTDLHAWQYGHKAALAIYKITKQFPESERFGLVNQLRRAAVSITSNIAEGFSRQTGKEKIQFYFVAKGSVTECRNQLMLAKDLSFIATRAFEDLENQLITVHKLLTGLIKSVRGS